MFIKKIFDGNPDEEVHLEFLKFSRGEFRNKYLIEAKKQKDKWSVKTTHEFANFFVRKCLESAPAKVHVSGVIVSTLNLKDEVKFNIEGIKQFMGIKQLQVNSEIPKNDILDLMNKYPRVFFALSFITQDCELKIKAKAPKSAKPSTSSKDEPKVDFCSLKTTNPNIIKELFFDFPNFSTIRIKHTLKINEIIYPKEEKDPVKVREMSKRKGILVRELEIDGKNEKREKEFIA